MAFKIGIIGVGSISLEHIQAYLANLETELYAFCDINEDRLNYMGKKFGITRLYTDIDEMLKLEELDAVSVCTWNNGHAPCTIKALKAGKHVLCEKPMASSILIIWVKFTIPRQLTCAVTVIPAAGLLTLPAAAAVLSSTWAYT